LNTINSGIIIKRKIRRRKQLQKNWEKINYKDFEVDNS
jgi:hypothetical protein